MGFKFTLGLFCVYNVYTKTVKDIHLISLSTTRSLDKCKNINFCFNKWYCCVLSLQVCANCIYTLQISLYYKTKVKIKLSGIIFGISQVAFLKNLNLFSDVKVILLVIKLFKKQRKYWLSWNSRQFNEFWETCRLLITFWGKENWIST